MACGDGKIFASGPWTATEENFQYFIRSENSMDDLPQFLIGLGFDCASARDFLEANGGGPNFFGGVVKNGVQFPRPSAANCTLTGTGVGYTLAIQKLPAAPVDGGFFSMSEVDGFVDSITWPGPWPLTMGVDADYVIWTQSGGDGASSVQFNSQASSKLIGFDYNSWWCCAAAPSGCTEGCGAPVVSFAPRFLIPPPSPIQPGEENVSTPLLYTPIYLSNHTFQMTPNYGRVK